MTEPVRFLSVCGMLGYGFPPESLVRGLQGGADFMGVDAGSTDPGPYYLCSGTGFVNPVQVKRDLGLALCKARQLDIPLIIGSASGSGAAPHVEQFLAILGQVAAEHELHFRMAVIGADIDKDVVSTALREGRISPCGGSGELSEEDIRASSGIVAQMGTGPFIEALSQGADVIVAGRSCDTAVFAAYPIYKGLDAGLALHCAKIAECGTLCARPGGANDCLMATVGEDSFTVEPANPLKRCTPETVAAHALYEQPDPNCFYEPEGKVDLTGCAFEPWGERGVKVSGSRLVPAAEATVKLEGAALRGYRSVAIAGTRDPLIIEHLDDLEAGVRVAVARNLAGVIPEESYSLRFLRYGSNAVMGSLEPPSSTLPWEVGLVIEAVAATQDDADTVLSLARSTALHQDFPGRKTTAGNLAFPFSPSDLHGGPVYEFTVYHLLQMDDVDSLFPVAIQDV